MVSSIPESRIADVVDELWRRYDKEAWLGHLVQTGDAGKKLRQIAISLIKNDGEAALILNQLRLMQGGLSAVPKRNTGSGEYSLGR